MRRRLQKFKCMRGRRRIDDFDLEARGAMHIVELLERRIGLSARELFREIAVERIFQNPFARCRGFDESVRSGCPTRP